jgi:hypothetical protein
LRERVWNEMLYYHPEAADEMSWERYTDQH